MSDPAIDAAQRAHRALWEKIGIHADANEGYPTSHEIAAAREALAPIREVLDRCAEATVPPCDFVDLFAEYEKAIDAISSLIYSTEELS